ncbi:hypothetical protein HDU97_005270 [Phlyctochytrium planicorne]|nr:hypothetical protein HDU97_005270 [Phlyctochytrium planicorne]
MNAPNANQAQAQTDDMLGFMSTSGYSQSFFGCFGDLPTAIATYCCGCLVVGATAGKLWKGGNFDIPACLCSGIGAYRIRRHTQKIFGIQESEDASAFAVGCLGCCSVTQDVHELSARGVIAPLLGGPAQTAQPSAAPQMSQPQ